MFPAPFVSLSCRHVLLPSSAAGQHGSRCTRPYLTGTFCKLLWLPGPQLRYNLATCLQQVTQVSKASNISPKHWECHWHYLLHTSSVQGATQQKVPVLLQLGLELDPVLIFQQAAAVQHGPCSHEPFACHDLGRPLASIHHKQPSRDPGLAAVLSVHVRMKNMNLHS